MTSTTNIGLETNEDEVISSIEALRAKMEKMKLPSDPTKPEKEAFEAIMKAGIEEVEKELTKLYAATYGQCCRMEAKVSVTFEEIRCPTWAPAVEEEEIFIESDDSKWKKYVTQKMGH